MRNIAIIPARGGSKRIPHKNIRLFLEKPIIAYSIEAAINSELFDEVMVSTDDRQIAEIAQLYGAKVPFLRSATTSNDTATTSMVVLEVLEQYEKIGKHFDTVTCIYATAPFVTIDQLKEAHEKMEQGHFDTVFTAVAYSYPVQSRLIIEDGKIRMVHPEYVDTCSQDFQINYHDAGQFYVATVESFRKEKRFWGKNSGGIILSELEVQDLDTETDWKLAEMKYKLLHH